MRVPFMLLCTALGLSGLQAATLSSADREALLEKLDNLEASAESKVDSRFRVALTAYRSAMSDGKSATEFYLKCVEKVDFEDKKKKPSQFRDWKRKHSDRLSDPAFKLALRYQLQWLILSLEASAKDADRQALAVEVQEVVDSIFSDASKLDGQQQILRQAATSSIFARAYDIGNIRLDAWSDSPIALDTIYGEIIFPYLRRPDRVDSLRATWIKRINQEASIVEGWSTNGKGRRGGDSGTNSTAYAKFVSDRLPQLRWQMEMDVFRSGDEAGAAMRMLAHIEKYITHKSARAWSKEFQDLLKPKPVVPTATTQEEP